MGMGGPPPNGMPPMMQPQKQVFNPHPHSACSTASFAHTRRSIFAAPRRRHVVNVALLRVLLGALNHCGHHTCACYCSIRLGILWCP